ncbi:helix-turn-helix transcriptional regulator [Nanoarchaeota archaeon]
MKFKKTTKKLSLILLSILIFISLTQIAFSQSDVIEVKVKKVDEAINPITLISIVVAIGALVGIIYYIIKHNVKTKTPGKEETPHALPKIPPPPPLPDIESKLSKTSLGFGKEKPAPAVKAKTKDVVKKQKKKEVFEQPTVLPEESEQLSYETSFAADMPQLDKEINIIPDPEELIKPKQESPYPSKEEISKPFESLREEKVEKTLSFSAPKTTEEIKNIVQKEVLEEEHPIKLPEKYYKPMVDEDYKHLKEDELIIVRLLKMRDGMCEQGTLRVVSGFSKATLSRILSEMESRGYVHKELRGKKNMVYLRDEF